jgi:hypothetical protein
VSSIPREKVRRSLFAMSIHVRHSEESLYTTHQQLIEERPAACAFPLFLYVIPQKLLRYMTTEKASPVRNQKIPDRPSEPPRALLLLCEMMLTQTRAE